MLPAVKIKFKVYIDEEFIAEKECLVKIPKYAPRSFEVLEQASMCDVGGITRWYALLQDFTALQKYEPEKADKSVYDAMRARFGCP